MRDKHLGKSWLLMEDADHSCFLQPHDLAFRHCRRGRQAHRLPVQASFSAEFVRPQDGDDGFLALLRDNGDFDLAVLDIEHRIRRFTLREDRFALPIFGDAPTAIYGGEKYLRVEWNFFRFLCHGRCSASASGSEETIATCCGYI